MQYWLIKSEPNVYSWDRLVAETHAVWDGIRNYQARNNLQAMKRGDIALFYHSNIGKEIVGIAEVVHEAYPDPTSSDAGWVCVDIIPKQPLHRPVTLAAMQAELALQQLALFRQPRLSVMPVTSEEFECIITISGKALNNE